MVTGDSTRVSSTDSIFVAASAMRGHATRRASFRKNIPWPDVSGCGSVGIADVVASFNSSYRSAWAGLEAEVNGFADRLDVVCEAYEATEQALTDAFTV